MAKFAIIENGTVVNIADAESALGDDWIEWTEGVEKGDMFDGDVFTKPAIPLPDRKAAMLDELADIRWRHETGGIVVGGSPIKTDGESQRKLTSAYVQAEKDSGFVIDNWKIAPGVFVPLNAATIIAIGDAVTAHVQACFDHEGAVTTAILAAEDHDALDMIDMGAGWP